jgi:hypothetical protein
MENIQLTVAGLPARGALGSRPLSPGSIPGSRIKPDKDSRAAFAPNLTRLTRPSRAVWRGDTP